MNYTDLLRHRTVLTHQISMQLFGELKEIAQAMCSIRKIIMEHNPTMWISDGSDTDVVELLRLTVRPATFSRICQATLPHAGQWAAMKSAWTYDKNEVFAHLKYILLDAPEEERVEFMMANFFCTIMQMGIHEPCPVKMLIKGTIFEAIWNRDRAAFNTYRETTPINTTLPPREDTCLMFAIRYKCLDVLDWILEDAVCRLETMNAYGETALDLARSMRLETVEQRLLSMGAFDH